MTPQEANKIISDYMGWVVDGDNGCDFALYKEKSPHCSIEDRYYSEPANSLDTLIPAWEKLSVDEVTFLPATKGWNLPFFCSVFIYGNNSKSSAKITESGKTIQEAAAIATAKLIQEMKDG